MSAIGQRLRELRESAKPKVSQQTLGDRLGRSQRWISGRELGEVGTTVEEAVEIIAALGLAAELVVVPSADGPLLHALADLDPDGTATALRLAAVWPLLDKPVRDMLAAMLRQAEQSVRPANRA